MTDAQEPGEEPAGPVEWTLPRQPALRWLAVAYGRWLASLERGLVIAMALVVVLFGADLLLTVESGIIVGNASWPIIDLSTSQTMVYATTFYLCLFGGVIATRRNNHIAVDAITPHLRPAIRLRLEGVLLLISAAVALYIAAVAQRYVDELIAADDSFIPGKDGWFWAKRTWRWPAVLAFGWMALHFAVGGVVRLLGREPHELGLEAPPHAEHRTGFAHREDLPDAPSGEGSA